MAWFKVYYPVDFYCSVFSEQREFFKAEYMCKGLETLVNRKNMLCNLINYDNDESELEDKCSNLKDELRMCEIVEEMYQRGISFAPIDINSSHATDFIKIGSNIILPPLNVIDGITDQVARVITCSREEKPIKSRNDLLSRMQIGYVTLVNLDKYGLLDNIPEDNQMNIFDIIDSWDSEGADD